MEPKESSHDQSFEGTPTYFQDILDEGDEAILQAEQDKAEIDSDIENIKDDVTQLMAEVAIFDSGFGETVETRAELFEKTRRSIDRINNTLDEAIEVLPEVNHPAEKTKIKLNKTTKMFGSDTLAYGQAYPFSYIDIEHPQLAEFLGDHGIMLRSSRVLTEASYTEEKDPREVVKNGGYSFEANPKFTARIDTKYEFSDAQTGVEITLDGKAGSEMALSVSDGLHSMSIEKEELKDIEGFDILVKRLVQGAKFKRGVYDVSFDKQDKKTRKANAEKAKSARNLEEQMKPLLGKNLTMDEMREVRAAIELHFNGHEPWMNPPTERYKYGVSEEH